MENKSSHGKCPLVSVGPVRDDCAHECQIGFRLLHLFFRLVSNPFTLDLFPSEKVLIKLRWQFQSQCLLLVLSVECHLLDDLSIAPELLNPTDKISLHKKDDKTFFLDSLAIMSTYQRLESEQHRSAFRVIVNHLCRLDLKNAAFPGGMPMALTKERFQDSFVPQVSKYMWSPKADGVRSYLLFTSINKSTEPYQVLIDRSWNMWLVKLKIPYCFYDGTLIDGEWITSKRLFVAFDILSICGLPLLNIFSWSARRQILEKAISLIPTKEDDNIKCILKPFYPITQLSNKPSSPCEMPSDGIIFTRQDLPISFFRDMHTFKWKQNNKQTIDLFVEYVQAPGVIKSIYLYAVNNRRPVLYRQQTEQQCGECETCKETKRPPVSSLIRKVVEFEPCLASINQKHIIWHPVSVRSDKAHPNSIPVILDVERILKGESVSWDDILALTSMHNQS